ncbi:MAG: BatD family protein [Candidatus Omnitrophota bacterium]
MIEITKKKVILSSVIPAKAGIQSRLVESSSMDSRLRGNDKLRLLRAMCSMLCIAYLSLYATECHAEDVRFEVTVDKNKISLGTIANLSFTFYGTQDVGRLDLPDIRGFNWRYLGPSTRMSIVNGRVSSSITHSYALLPLEAGDFSIPPLSVYYNGKTYNSDPIPIQVVSGPFKEPASSPPGNGANDQAEGLKDRLFLTMEVSKRKAYVNEIIPVTVKLYINQLDIRDVQYPVLLHEGFSVDKFPEPKQYREVIGNIAYNVIELNTNIFGMRPGELKLGPAEIKCNLLAKNSRRQRSRFFDDDFFDSFFTGGAEKYPLTLTSQDTPVTIVPLPQEGIPPDFNGALGDYEFSLKADPKKVKVGDPITLRMTVTGKGNFKTVTPPTLEFGDDFKIYQPEARQDQTGKVFEQVIIPKKDTIEEIPEVSFSYFDTRAGKYKITKAGPIPIEVEPLPAGESLKIFETPEGISRAIHRREILGRDIIFIKDSPGRLKPKGKYLYENSLFKVMQFAPILAIVSVLILQRRKDRLNTDIRYARRLRASGKAKKNLRKARRALGSKTPDIFFDAVFKTLQEYIGDKFHLPTAGITSSVVETLQYNGVNTETLDKIRECFNNCDMARYASSSITKGDMAGTLKLLEEIVDKLERAKV